jgi:hypothetical protein
MVLADHGDDGGTLINADAVSDLAAIVCIFKKNSVDLNLCLVIRSQKPPAKPEA